MMAIAPARAKIPDAKRYIAIRVSLFHSAQVLMKRMTF